MKAVTTVRVSVAALAGRIVDHYLESLGLGYIDVDTCVLCGGIAEDFGDTCDRCSAMIADAAAQLPPPAAVIAAAKAAHPAYMKRTASAGMSRHELVLLRRRAESDPGGVTWVEIQRLVEEADRLHIANCDVAALHVPWYDIDGTRHDHLVEIYWEKPTADHVCRTGFGVWPACDAEEGQHAVPACVECRQTTEDGEAGYVLWPCPTARLITGTAAA